MHMFFDEKLSHDHEIKKKKFKFNILSHEINLIKYVG